MAHGPDTELHKGLTQRHLTMIALGGVIGAGLFVGSGVGDQRQSGPAPSSPTRVTGVLIVMVMRMLGEMATANPPPARSPTMPARPWVTGPASRSAGCTGTSG